MLRHRNLPFAAPYGLAISLAISLLALARAAQAAPTLSVGSASGAAGSSVNIPINFDPGTDSIGSMNFDLTLPAGLSTGTVTPGAIVTNAGKSISTNVINGNTWRVLVIGFNQSAIAAGLLGTFQINIAAGTPGGTLNLPISNINFTDINGNTVAGGTSTGGSVTVISNNPVPTLTSLTPNSTVLGTVQTLTLTGTNFMTGASGTTCTYNGTAHACTVNSATSISMTLVSADVATAGSPAITVVNPAPGGGTSNSLTFTINPPANITLTKSASAPSAKSGDIITFTIQYQNTSTGAASNVVITDLLPSGTTLVTGSITGGGVLSGNTITWNLGTVAGNASGQVSFQVKVN